MMRNQLTCLLLLAGLVHSFASHAQKGFQIVGRVKVEGGGLDNSRVVIHKNGEKERTLTSGLSKFNLTLDYNANYTLSFEKDGYVTKTLVFDTKAPAQAVTNGFAPFEFAVSLFKQYDDVNTVVFNQPVGMIKYDPSTDDFDYDTDYTKSIQSQLQKTLEEVAEKQKEDEQKAREASKRQAEEAKAQAKREAEERKRNEAEAKAAEEDRKRAEAQRVAEERRAADAAKAAEEARKRDEAKAREEARRTEAAERTAPPVPPVMKETPPPPKVEPRVVQRNTTAAKGVSGEDGRRMIQPVMKEEHSPVRAAPAVALEEARPKFEASERLVVRDEELIVEPSKVVTVIRLDDGSLTTEYRRVVYKWGGVFYFKNGDSCTQEIYELEALAGR